MNFHRARFLLALAGMTAALRGSAAASSLPGRDAPAFAETQVVVAAGPVLPPGVRDRILLAANDPGLPSWQHAYMLGLAGARSATGLTPAGVAAPSGTPTRTSTAMDGAWSELVLAARHGHAAIYDSVRDRMVIFGGTDDARNFNDVWALSLAGTPVWTNLRPTGTPPSARYDLGAIYDPLRDRMVLFGGRDATGDRNDTWVLSLGGRPAWSALAPVGAPPAARSGQSAIYDPVRDRMVVFGGQGNDVWALSLAGTPGWANLAPTGTPPSERAYQSAIYDPVRDRMVMFGGLGLSGVRNDAWSLSLAGTPGWTALSPTGVAPAARMGHSAIYDPVRDRMLVFGGFTPANLRNDTWSLSLDGTPAWTGLSPTGGPPSVRSNHSTIYDPLRDRMVVFGQVADVVVWGLSLAGTPAWAALTSSGDGPPSGRQGHSAMLDPVRDRMVVFGGDDGSSRNDVWALSLAGAPGWTVLAPAGPGPSPRSGQSAIYDPVRGRMVVFGGGSNQDVWALSLAGAPQWNLLTPTGTPPSGRFAHGAIYDPVRDRMLVFGGADLLGPKNDVWALSLAGVPSWTELTPAGSAPSARSGHSAIYDPVRDRMVLFGGTGLLGTVNDLWELALAGTATWAALTPAGTPPGARSGHSAIYDPERDRMVMFAGGDHAAWELSLAGTPTWAVLAPDGERPGTRSGHSAIYDPLRHRMVVFGGNLLNDAWALEWSPPVGVGDSGPPLRVSFLQPPVPNPAQSTTRVSYSIARTGPVTLGVYDVRGRLVRGLVDGERPAGNEAVSWDGTRDSGGRLGPGLYFVRLAEPGILETRKLILLR